MPSQECPPGHHKRHSYTSKRGKHVASRCIPSRSRSRKQNHTRKACPPGKILRAPYVRKFASSVRAAGYNRTTKTGKVVHVNPTKKSPILVRASCITDRGKKGKGEDKIGPLRKGELAKFGYSTRIERKKRHSALMRAIGKYGALSVFRKLDAVAKLSANTEPDISKIFSDDRDWVHRKFAIGKA